MRDLIHALVTWILFIVFCMTYGLFSVIGSPCEDGWFGDECIFKCHCAATNSCHHLTGACPNGCEATWFGTACQYKSTDMTVKIEDVVTDVLTDDDNDTCIPSNTKRVDVYFSVRQPTVWFRLFTSTQFEATSELGIAVAQDDYTWLCKSTQPSLVFERGVDYMCITKESAQGIVIMGTFLSSVCSLYVSLGQNYALKQETRQTSTLGQWYAGKAVDGIEGPADDQEGQAKTCMHTDYEKAQHKWEIRFRQHIHILRIDIYNRVNRLTTCCEYQLKGFKLTASIGIHVVFSYKDSSPLPQEVYNVVPEKKLTVPVDRVRITSGEESNVLSMCEVKVYGERACPLGKFGDNCEKKCRCRDTKDVCHVLTGYCPTGCEAGRSGIDCSMECPTGRWGVDCVHRCSIHCNGGLSQCSPQTGHCTHGCQRGYLMPRCLEAPCAETGYFGAACEHACHCKGECDSFSGECQGGCEDGYFGPSCQYKPAIWTSIVPHWMTEAKDHECKPAQLIPRTPLQFEETVITWLRITSTSKETLMSLSVTFKMSTRKEDSLVCSKDRFVIVGSPTLHTLDIECPSEKTWDIIVLQGTNLYTICGVFISLGRNLAVKSSIEGSPPENNETALHYAVDGILRPGSPCFEVSIDTVNTTTRIGHYFVVLVQKSMKLNRIELYAKRGLPLQVLSIEYVYPIYLRLLTSTPVVYSVDFEVLRLQIDTLLEEQSAFFRFRSNWEEQWSLCEAMFLGDTECPAGKFGVDCHLFCNCLDDEPCLLTGACEHGCKSGFTGFACQSECSSGLYGLGCKTKCSENCKDKQIPCNAVDGFCVGGCDDGYEPPLCFKKCVKGKYGPGCSRLCGQFCKGGYSKCHHVTGVCAEGCEPGAKRPNCEHKCDPHTYGINCEGRCNETCVGKLCDWKTGHCGDCIVGYKGEFCETACSKSWYGLRCSSSCSEYCKDRECYTTNGSCFQCVVGRTGQFCKETCIHGRFGERCSAVCSLNCVGGFRKCNIETGACEEGCEGGYKPPFCNVLIANDTDREIIEIIQQSLITRPMLVFFVGFLGVLCALGIVEALFLYAMRKRSQRNYKNASKADNEEDIQAPPYGSLVTDVGSPTVTFVDPEEDEVDTTLDQALLLEHLTKVRQYKEYHRSSDSSEDEEAS